MTKNFRFSTTTSSDSLQNLIKTYFLNNGFYELKSAEGLKFTKVPKSKEALAPERLMLTITVFLEAKDQGTIINQRFHSQTHFGIYTGWDHDYKKVFHQHFKQSIENQIVSSFEFQANKPAIQRYSRRYIIILTIITILLLGLLIYMNAVTELIGALVLILPLLGYFVLRFWDKSPKNDTYTGFE